MRTIRLTETALKRMIKKIVAESVGRGEILTFQSGVDGGDVHIHVTPDLAERDDLYSAFELLADETPSSADAPQGWHWTVGESGGKLYADPSISGDSMMLRGNRWVPA